MVSHVSILEFWPSLCTASSDFRRSGKRRGLLAVSVVFYPIPKRPRHPFSVLSRRGCTVARASVVPGSAKKREQKRYRYGASCVRSPRVPPVSCFYCCCPQPGRLRGPPVAKEMTELPNVAAKVKQKSTSAGLNCARRFTRLVPLHRTIPRTDLRLKTAAPERV